MESDAYITATMKRFKLVDVRDRYPELIREAEEKHLGYKEFLINLLKAEDSPVDHRRVVLLENGQGKREPFLSGCTPKI